MQFFTDILTSACDFVVCKNKVGMTGAVEAPYGVAAFLMTPSVVLLTFINVCKVNWINDVILEEKSFIISTPKYALQKLYHLVILVVNFYTELLVLLVYVHLWD